MCELDRSQCAADIIFSSGFGKSEVIWQHKIFWNVTKCKIVFKDSSWFVFIWCHHSYIHLINCGKVKSIETIWTPDSTFLGLLAHPSVGRAGQTNYMGGSQKAFLCQFLPFKPSDCRYFFSFHMCVSKPRMRWQIHFYMIFLAFGRNLMLVFFMVMVMTMMQ